MEANTPILTIAIPTYNRAAKLDVQLTRLLPQLTAEVRLCVYDNASPDDTREVMAKYLSRGVSYFRASTNCGAGRNVFRCFEECQTEWLWVLCDDDLATTSAVADLLAILRHETCDFVHTYSWICPYTQDTVVTDLPSLFQHSNVSSLWWITSGIYRLSSFRPLFRLYNDAISTWGPHLVMVLSLLESGNGKVNLSPVKLTLPTTTPIAWSTCDFILRSSLVPEYLTHPVDRRLVADRIVLELFNELMAVGLRETVGKQQIHKWQRVYAQSRGNLRAYQASGIRSYVMKNWCRPGRRKSSLRLALQAIQIKLLSWCPVRLFHVLAGLLPLPTNLRDEYDKRNDYTSST